MRPTKTTPMQDNEWKWDKEQEKAFKQIKDAIKKITEIKHFKKETFQQESSATLAKKE